LTTYTYEEVFKNCKEYFNNDELASKVLIDKYLLRDKQDNLLEQSPNDMFKRLALKLAKIEKKKFKNPLTEQEIFGYLDGFKKIILQGSIQYGLGNPYRYISLANCVSLPPIEDSYGGICHNDELIVQTAKRRMGSGVDLSKLRPKDMPTTNSSNSSTGIISWMKRNSHAIREVGQHGRRGALLMMLDVRHPQILDFIRAKQKEEEIVGANISVKLCDEFMDAVLKNKNYEQRWPIDNSNIPEISNEVNARDIWNEIIKNARNYSEPGLLFWDTILRESVADCYPNFQTTGTNACSELPMSSYSGCILLVINLYTYVKNKFSKDAYFDYEEFYNDCKILQRLADDIVDAELECITNIQTKLENDPEPEEIKRHEKNLWQNIYLSTMRGRRTGCGTTALADCFAALRVKYGSKESIELADDIYKTLKLACYESSVDIAKEIGPFPDYDGKLEKENPFLNKIKDEDIKLYNRMKRFGRSNIACLTNSPAGSVSILSQSTSGIEPLLYQTSVRKKKGNAGDKDFRVDSVDQNGDCWMHFEVTHPKIKDWSEITNTKNIEKSPWFDCTAQKLNYKDRTKLQSTIQQHIDHNISNTVNLPEDITEKEVSKIYLDAWKTGLKGITVYREGSRSGVIIQKEKTDKSIRPKTLKCEVFHPQVNYERYFVLVGLWEDQTPYEVFAGKNGIHKDIIQGIIVRKKKGFYKAEFPSHDEELSPATAGASESEEIISRLTSLALRNHVPIRKIVKQLELVGEKNNNLHNFARAISRTLKKYITDGEKENSLCPKCNNELVRIGGCPMCQSCGFSKCL